MKRAESGFSVVEVVIAAALVLAVVGAAAAAWQAYLRLSNSSSRSIAAALLLDEGSEAVQLWRDASWTGDIAPVPLNTPYYLYWTGSAYATSTSPVLIQNAYTRTLTFKSVSRDSNFNIISSGGTVDPDTKDVTIVVYAGTSSTAIATSEMLIHDVFNN